MAIQVRIAVFSQHHVDGLDLSSNPLLYMMRCYPVSSLFSYVLTIDLGKREGKIRTYFSSKFLTMVSKGIVSSKPVLLNKYYITPSQEFQDIFSLAISKPALLLLYAVLAR